MRRQANALAADLEDVLLRFRGNPDDADTIRRVVDDLLASEAGRPASIGTRYFVTDRVAGELVVVASGRDLQPLANELRDGQIVWEAAPKVVCIADDSHTALTAS